MSEWKDSIKQHRDDERSRYRKAIHNVESVLYGTEKSFYSGIYEEDSIAELFGAVLRYFRMPFVEVPPKLLQEEQMEYLLDVTGIMHRQVNLEGDWWKNDATPLMIRKKDTEKYVTLIPAKYGGYKYYDSEKKKEIRVTGNIATQFEKEAWSFYKPMPDKSMSLKDFVVFLMGNYNMSDVLFLLMVSFITTCMGLIVPLVNEFIFERIIPSGMQKDILPVTVLLFGVIMATGLFRILRTIWVARVGDKVKIAVEAAIWNRTMRLPVNFYHQYESGDLTQRVMMMGGICDVINTCMMPVIFTVLFSLVYLLQIRNFSEKLVEPSVIILVLMIVFAVGNSFFRATMNKKINALSSKMSGFTFQLFSGIAKIKTTGSEVRAFSKWADIFAKQTKIKIAPPLLVRFAQVIMSVIQICGTILIYLVVFHNELSLSEYVSFQVAFGNLSAAILQLTSVAGQIAFVKPAYDMVAPILKEAPESDSSKLRVAKLEGQIDLSNVHFRYQPDMDYVLSGLDMCIKKGEYVALTGPSGCGKSTLFRLLLGFLQPEIGAIYYDEKDYNTLDYRSVRRRIGTVLQDGKLFPGDIYSNIALCAPWITMEEAWEAAELAGIADDIKKMPMGMYTIIPENGAGISGGQKQRILIARALAMKPDVLLFDEATSALDNLTQSVIVNALEKMKITRIVIAHRLSTIQKCDRILYFERGKVEEEGTYEELMKLNGKFTKLAKRQLV